METRRAGGEWVTVCAAPCVFEHPESWDGEYRIRLKSRAVPVTIERAPGRVVHVRHVDGRPAQALIGAGAGIVGVSGIVMILVGFAHSFAGFSLGGGNSCESAYSQQSCFQTKAADEAHTKALRDGSDAEIGVGFGLLALAGGVALTAALVKTDSVETRAEPERRPTWTFTPSSPRGLSGTLFRVSF